jgi:hypothetical protein
VFSLLDGGGRASAAAEPPSGIELKAVNGARDTLSGSRGTVAAASNDREQAATGGGGIGRRPQTAAAARWRDRKPGAAKPALRKLQEASATAAQRPALGTASWWARITAPRKAPGPDR